jgi:hypothetical protein
MIHVALGSLLLRRIAHVEGCFALGLLADEIDWLLGI